MTYWILCAVVFFAAYLINILYVTVFYHRALTHSAVKLSPGVQKFVVWSGNWVTGLDPKGWTCMHRLHHQYSDTPKDPHSPVQAGIFAVLLIQLRSYQRTLLGLIAGKPYYADVVKDLEFPVNWLNRKGLWLLPYLLHAGVALVIGFAFHAWLLGACYWLGMMSHPVQGWMVNALAHHFGYRNFETPDNSRNNTMVSWLVFGEGYQNNHHYYPQSARFSVKWFEVDTGYLLCRGLQMLGVLTVNKNSLIAS